MIYTYLNFGYEGNLVSVECDLRNGTPSFDIVGGIAEGSIIESRGRIRSAIINSDIKMPNQRILISLSPVDLKKDDVDVTLPIALSILQANNTITLNEDTLVLGELCLNGNIRSVGYTYAAIQTAYDNGIRKVICSDSCTIDKSEFPNIEIKSYNSLSEIVNDYQTENLFEDYKFDNTTLVNKDALEVLTIACAGKHHMLFTWKPGCGKTMMIIQLMKCLTPMLTNDELSTTKRIWSIASLNHDSKEVPFRMPHQTATIEGMCGGGTNCRPGEISLAHNGILFLDETHEFKSSVLRTLRVPIESHQITLCRAGRTTVYPANFQLVMATNPCPCGNYGNKDKVCLCSARSIEQYWNKLGNPLLDRIELRYNFNTTDETAMVNLSELREKVSNAYHMQKIRGSYNRDLTPQQISEYCNLTESIQEYLDSKIAKDFGDLPIRQYNNVLKVARTLADMELRTDILEQDIDKSIKYVLNSCDVSRLHWF